jgi:hypothetical protein
MSTHTTSGPDWVIADSYGNVKFSADAISRFPSLKADLEEDAELLHVQMGTLAGAVRKALERNGTQHPLEICAFLDEVLRNPRAISEIENAVAISFVEAKEFRASAAGQEVLSRMPVTVRDVLLAQEARGGAQ